MIPGSLLLLSALFAVPPPPTPAERDRYAQCLNHYRAGNLQAAQEALQSLATSTTAVAPAARFALANADVRLAARDRVSADVAEQHLHAAIVAYRKLLDAGSTKLVSRSDVLHNLELAKRMLAGVDRSPDSNYTRPTATRRQPSETRPASEAHDQLHAKPSDRRDVASEKRRTRDDRGKVLDPLPGEKLVDAGELSMTQARENLRNAMSRIEADAQRRRETVARSRPPMAGDY